jgi:LmbE family N-acetylglucosaminyl deacetylase
VRWIFLSPHFDDIVLSCGGLLWELSQAGQAVEIWTICSGPPPEGPFSAFAESLHARWKTGPQAVSARKAEDQAACAVIGARWRYLDIPDCIYRPGGNSGSHYYATEESLFGELHPAEAGLVVQVAAEIRADLVAGDQIVAPMTLGGHVDHRLTRQAADRLVMPLLYYADYPYRIQSHGQLTALAAGGWRARQFPVSPGGLKAWQNAIAAHASQISTFWPDLAGMRDAIYTLWETDEHGIVLWSPSE